MACPICGDLCRCIPQSRLPRGRIKSRFEPDAQNAVAPTTALVDPEAYDATEQQFAASLDDTVRTPRFIVTTEADEEPKPGHEAFAASREVPGSADDGEPTTIDEPTVLGLEPASAWRKEVAARVDRYRSRRRPRQPRYPSLHLKFDGDQGRNQHEPATAILTQQALAQEDSSVPRSSQAHALAPHSLTESSARILEFPRSSLAPPRPPDELAEPMFDRPRILEAPEVVPPPPALGGILIEPQEKGENERRPGFEIPLKYAPLSRRLLAAAVDAFFVCSAVALFLYIVLEVTAVRLPFKLGILMAGALGGVFWASYQYLSLLYSGSTFGLKCAGLELRRFDDSSVPRRLRRWRALVAILSGLSLGLGYAWCFLDEDQLCWHDRITKTYMAPKA